MNKLVSEKYHFEISHNFTSHIWNVQALLQLEIKMRSRPYSHSERCEVVLSSLMEFWSNSSDCMARFGANMT